jgi:hypothetical protein
MRQQRAVAPPPALAIACAIRLWKILELLRTRIRTQTGQTIESAPRTDGGDCKMLSTLTILSLDQGKIYRATHPHGRPDERSMSGIDSYPRSARIADIDCLVPETAPSRRTSGLLHSRDWLVLIVALRRAL